MKKNGKIFTLATLLITVFAFNAYAVTINIPADYGTIQAGINAATNGDIVLVQTGSYVENINYNGKLITVASLFHTTQDTSYISQTIIDGNSSGSVIIFENGEDITSVLCGFSIINGSANLYGGGIDCHSSSPSLEDVIISGNSATYYGGGIHCDTYSSPSLENVIISGNSAEYGGGIYCQNNSSPRLDNVTISGNSAFSYYGGGIFCSYSNPILESVIISDNSAAYYGGGIFCYYSSPSLDNVTITDNSASSGGGIYSGDNSSPTAINSILWNNTPEEIVVESASISISYSDIEGTWTGTGNVNADPLFVDTLNGNYHLSWANFPTPDATMSPCIDTGDPASPLDPDGTRADMGAYYFNQNSTSVDPQEISDFMLTNFPNPVSVHINDLSVSFSIQKPSRVQIQLFNLKGQIVETLVNEDKTVGEHTATYSVNELSSGIYFTKLSIDGVEKEITKLVVLK